MKVAPTLPPKENETVVSELFQHLLKCWNERDALGFSALFTAQGTAIGFDGTQMNGPEEIEDALEQVFKDHITSRYVWKIREIRLLSPDVALLRAVTGMVHPDRSDIDPSRNAVQSLVAMKNSSNWLISLFQNTPASFDGRAVAAMELTNELQQVLNSIKDPMLV